MRMMILYGLLVLDSLLAIVNIYATTLRNNDPALRTANGEVAALCFLSAYIAWWVLQQL